MQSSAPEGNTAGPPIRRRSNFVGQAVLILLPLLCLAGLGLLSVRQDRRFARQKAQAQADTLAAALADQVYADLSQTDRELPQPAGDPRPQPNRPAFRIGNHGQLRFPPAVHPLSEPAPLHPGELSAAAHRLWEQARAEAFSTNNPKPIITAWQQFLASHPPSRFAAAATYQLALAWEARGARDKAVSLFTQINRSYPRERTGSDVPYATLALWQRLRLDSTTPNVHPAEQAALVQSLGSNLVFAPSPLTPMLLEQVAHLTGTNRATRKIKNTTTPSSPSAPITLWSTLWTEHERARALYAATVRALSFTNFVTPQPSAAGATNAVDPWSSLPTFFWVNGPAVDAPRDLAASESSAPAKASFWLLTRVPGRESWWVGRPQAAVRQDWLALVHRLRSPDYLGFAATVAGRHLGADSGAPLATRTTTARSRRSGRSTPLVQVTAYLAAPTRLYAQVRSRMRWLVALVLAATSVAVIGLLAAYRAFARQLRLSEMKSNFVSSVSHELRAPIASVRLLAESLDRGKITDKPHRRAYFRLIVQECRRLSSLIENMLDFSRIDQGRKQYEMEPIDLDALVRQTVELMESYAAEREVRLTVQVEGEPPRLNADGKALQQALVNLIDNAVKHSPPGETVTVRIEPRPAVSAKTAGAALAGHRRLRSETADTGAPASWSAAVLRRFLTGRGTAESARTQVRPQASRAPDQTAPRADSPEVPPSGAKTAIRPSVPEAETALEPSTPRYVGLFVADHGPGIPLAEQQRIFEPFYRRGSELRRETTGVGIGLSIVKHVAEAHGGCVTVQSTPDQGSRFIIVLPAKHPLSPRRGRDGERGWFRGAKRQHFQPILPSAGPPPDNSGSS